MSSSLDPIERTNLAFSAGAVAVSLALAPPAFALGLATGAAIEALNFRGLRRSAELVFTGAVATRRFGAAGFGARFVLLAVAIGVALTAGANPAGLLVGLSLILPAAVIEAWRMRPPLDENAPALSPDDEEWERWDPWLAREREPDPDPDEEGA